MLKQYLSQKQLQKLSPQQIQLMKLLQIPTINLEQRIQEELESNPALEETEDEYSAEAFDESPSDPFDSKEEKTNEYEEESFAPDEEVSFSDYLKDYIEEDDTASYKLRSDNYDGDEEERTIPIAVESSLNDFLEQQLGMTDLDEREQKIALQIIGSFDDDGYLRRETQAIADDLTLYQNIPTKPEEVEDILYKIQDFDPMGIGARTLQECLEIQLKRKLLMDTEEKHHHYQKLALKMLKNYFEEFSKKHYEKLQRYLGVDQKELKMVIDEVLHLNPKPGSGYSSPNTKFSNQAQYVVCDFSVTSKGGELELNINSRNAPELRISGQYKDMLKEYSKFGDRQDKKQKEAVMFIKQKIDSAKWFIDAIRQRQQTMYKTMYAILQYQYEYFLTGDERKIKPMILKDIAEMTGLDISTVSRVANSKYVETEFGIKLLKEFFSEGLLMEDGEEVSSLEVKQIILEMIEHEDKDKPLSDELLMKMLMEKGYNIARRTVAKYREQLNIPVARLRKEL